MIKVDTMMKSFNLIQWMGIIMLLGCTNACGSEEEDVNVDVDTDMDVEVVEDDFLKFQAVSSVTENILPSIDGPFQETLNSPGAVIKIDGTYYLFYNDYVNGWPPSDIRIGIAKSDNMTLWERMPEVILSGEHIGYLNGSTEHPSVSSVLVEDDGSIRLYFDIFKNGDGRGVGMATAPGIDGPWTAHNIAVLTPTPGTWDKDGIASSEVIKMDNGYRMYYAVFMDGRANPEMGIGMATSEDGIFWTKHPEPVFTKSDDEAWDNHKVEVPRIIKTDKGFVMAYRSDDGHSSWGGNTGYGIATSHDGITWERYQEQAVVHESYFPWATVWACAFYKEDNTYYMFIETDGPPAPGTRVNIVSYEGDFFD